MLKIVLVEGGIVLGSQGDQGDRGDQGDLEDPNLQFDDTKP